MSKTISKSIGQGWGRNPIYAALAYNANDQFGGYQIKDVMHNTTYKEYFYDTSQYIYSSASGTLNIVGATVAVTGNLTISGTCTVTGSLTYGATAVPVATGYMGTLTVGIDDTGYDVKFYGATTAKYFLWDESADGVVLVGTFTETGNMTVTGTFTLTGAPTITGNMTLIGSLTLGVDDTGKDIMLYGATSGSYFHWDQATDAVIIVGSFTETGNMQLTGTLTVGVDATGYDVKFFGDTTLKYWLWDQDADGVVLVGTMTMTGALVVTGNVQITGTVTVGVDATGHDVKFYGDTTGKYWLWDQDADGVVQVGTLTVTGAVSITGAITIAGTNRLNFTDANTYIYASATTALAIISSATLAITSPAITITGATSHVGALTMATTSKIQFTDTATFINGSSANNMSITSPTVTVVSSTAILLDGNTSINAAHTLTTGTGGTNFLSKGTFGVTGTLLTLTAGTPLFQVMSTNNSTGTEAVQSYFESTYTGIGGIGQCLKAYLATNVAGGSYLTALYGVLDLKTAGGVTGLGSAVCAELILPGGAAGIGTFGVLELELGATASWSSSQAVNFIWAQVYGDSTAIGLFNHSGNLMSIVGLGVAATSHIFHTIATPTGTHGLRILIDGVGYDILLKATGA